MVVKEFINNVKEKALGKEAKIRYINPLVNGKRITEICRKAKKMIDDNLAYDMTNYVYLENINFDNQSDKNKYLKRAI